MNEKEFHFAPIAEAPESFGVLFVAEGEKEDISIPLPSPPMGFESGAEAQNKRDSEMAEALAFLQRLTGLGAYQTREEAFYQAACALKDEPCEAAPMVDFERFYPTLSDLNPAQKKAYLWWRRCFLSGELTAAPEAYHLLLLYEIANLTVCESPEEGLELLDRLFLSANSAGYACTSVILQTMADLMIYDTLPMDYLAHAARQDAFAAAEVFATEVLADPFAASAMGLSVLRSVDFLCHTKFLQSPYIRSHLPRAERAACFLLQALDERYQTECGGFLEKFAGARVTFYPPFSKLLFASKRPCRLKGAYPYRTRPQIVGEKGKLFVSLQGLQRDRQFASLLTHCMKALECLLREEANFRPALKYPEQLPLGLQKTVASALESLIRVEAEENRPVFSLNAEQLSKTRGQTAEIRRRLIEELGNETQIEESSPAEASAEVAGSSPISAGEGRILSLLLVHQPITAALKEEAESAHLLPLAYLDELQQKLFDWFGDTVLEESEGDWRLYEDYEEELAAMFGDNLKGE